MERHGIATDFVPVPWSGQDGESLAWSAAEAPGGGEVRALDGGEVQPFDDDDSPMDEADGDWSGHGDVPVLLAEDQPELRVEVAPSPKIADVVAAFPATLLARASADVPIDSMLWELNKGLNARVVNWIKRFWGDWDTVRKEVPRVPITIELIRLDDLAYSAQGANAFQTRLRLRDYVAKRNLTRGVLNWSHTANEAHLFKPDLEKRLGLVLDPLFDLSKTPLPSAMSGPQKVTHLLLIQGDFSALHRFVVADEVVVLDEFAFNKAVLTGVHKLKIAAIVRHLDASWVTGDIEHAAVLVIGHTDNRGTEMYNVDLGARRAEAVRHALAEGIEAIRLGSKFSLPTKSMGEIQPVIAHPKTPAQHARNRRVEVLLPPPKRRPWPQADLPKSLDDVIARGRKLLETTKDKLDPLGIGIYQARRLYCVLGKLRNARSDDEYINGYAATTDGAVRRGPPINVQLHVLRARQTLVGSGFYGPKASDADFLRALGWLDRMIWAGPHIFGAEVAQHGVATKTGVVQLSEWIGQRQRDTNSIYHCYHPDNW